MTCTTCGLLEKKNGGFYCHRFRKTVSGEEAERIRDCLYYCPVITEEGEPLSPQQHLIMQDQDLKRKKMRGPV